MIEQRGANLLAVSLIILMVFAILSLLRASGTLQTLELLAYDLIVKVNAAYEPAQSDSDSKIALVKVTEEDISQLGGWPVNDGTLGTVIKMVAQQSPRAIGLDIYRDVPVAPGTSELNAALIQNENVIAIYKFDSDSSPGVRPPTVLGDTNQIAFSDIVIDPDGVVRRGLAFLDNENQLGYSFALRLALAYLAPLGEQLKPASDDDSHFALGSITYKPISSNHGGYINSDSAGYQFMIDFTHDSGFPAYTLQDIIANNLPTNAFSDRLVIIGVDAISVKDTFATPQSRTGFYTSSGTPGMVLHGIIADQLIRSALKGDSPIKSLSEFFEYLLFLFVCALAGVCGLYCHSALRLLTIGAVGVIALWVIGMLWYKADYWVPVVPMLLAWLSTLTFVTAYLVKRERQDRVLLQHMFATQTSPEVAQNLWLRRNELLVEGRFRPQSLYVTVLFVDLGGFTGISEQLDANELMEWIYAFMAAATDEIVEQGGVVDDYFGDGIKANFGVPFARTHVHEQRVDAQAAVKCALTLIDRITQLNQQFPLNLPYVLRAGIHSGPVVLGGLGTKERQKYTSIGDTVNIAARLEGLGKELGTRSQSSIMISGQTAELVDGQFELHDHNEVCLRGRKVPINVFEVLDTVA